MRRIALSCFVLLLAAPLLAQAVPVVPPAVAPVWVTVAVESATLSVTLPAGATYRLGDAANNLWSAPVTVDATTSFSPLSYPANVFPFADPDAGTVKELDVLEAADAQLVSITDLSTKPATVTLKVVPALATLPAAHKVTFTNFQNSSIGFASLMFEFINSPAAGGAHAWGGTQMDMTIDGVTWTCSYGQNYTDGVYSLSCAAP